MFLEAFGKGYSSENAVPQSRYAELLILPISS
jgi:hypothetical protein